MEAIWSGVLAGRRFGARLSGPVRRAGLSHMSKELEEELFAPSSELHFSGGGAFIRMRIKDIQRHPADERQVLRRMVLAASGVVFMEHHIEWPMQVVFHTPMLPNDFQNPARRHALGQGNVVDRGLALAASLLPLALDAREQDKTRKALAGVLGCGNGGGAAAVGAGK